LYCFAVLLYTPIHQVFLYNDLTSSFSFSFDK